MNLLLEQREALNRCSLILHIGILRSECDSSFTMLGMLHAKYFSTQAAANSTPSH